MRKSWVSNIWLTRPHNQASVLNAELLERGANVLLIPMLEIEALAWNEEVKARILNFDNYDMAVFISTNAAKFGMECISNYWPQYPSHIKNFALGPSTGAVLLSYDQVSSYPEKAMSSEAVLALPEMHENQLLGRKVLIFRGLGGREVLAEGLRKKGAVVDYIELYQRNLPRYSAQYLEKNIENNAPDAIVISSAEALENFTKIFNLTLYPDMLKTPLFVSSLRICELAKNFGFEEIIAMSGANDEAIITSLEQEAVLTR